MPPPALQRGADRRDQHREEHQRDRGLQREPVGDGGPQDRTGDLGVVGRTGGFLPVSGTHTPTTVEQAAAYFGSTDTEAMQAHLHEISQGVDPGAHGVVILDRAGWHTTARLVIPDNLTLLPLPPRSPELNPVENVWQYLRQNWLSNRVFDTYEDILDAGCDAWNRLLAQPQAIMSLGLREWAHTGQ